MSRPIVYIDTCAIREGKFGEFDAVLQRLHLKARMLGNGSVTVHESGAGSAR